jgi:hypothetical protein
LTGFDPAMAFLNGFGASEVRWRRPWRRGGKRAERPPRCPISRWAGCL